MEIEKYTLWTGRRENNIIIDTTREDSGIALQPHLDKLFFTALMNIYAPAMPSENANAHFKAWPTLDFGGNSELQIEFLKGLIYFISLYSYIRLTF